VTTLLFPSSKGGVIKQQSFAQRVNRLAYDHQIRAQTESSSASIRIRFATPSERE
jgi:hypothetical protein